MESDVQEHRGIATLIKAGNPDRAADAMVDHPKRAKDRLRPLFEDDFSVSNRADVAWENGAF
jgi:DNA-binding GntR family transcriptional regulator